MQVSKCVCRILSAADIRQQGGLAGLRAPVFIGLESWYSRSFLDHEHDERDMEAIITEWMRATTKNPQEIGAADT